MTEVIENIEPVNELPVARPHVDVSFDLETLGIRADALILSIGACKFDRHTGEIGEQFYRIIDITDPLGGGTIDASTVVWWMNQSQAARDAIFTKTDALDAPMERVNLRQALVEFSEFIGFDDTLTERYPNATLWQRGDKDAQWLTSAYEGMNLQVPFAYWQTSDQRTLTSLFKPFLPTRYGVAHNSLDDAIYQAQCLVNVFKRLQSCGAFVENKPDVRPAATPETIRYQVLSTAYICGLNTVGEAIANMDHHAMSMWPYAEIPARMREIHKAFEDYLPEGLVNDLLTQQERDAIDADIDAHCRGNEGPDDAEQLDPVVVG